MTVLPVLEGMRRRDTRAGNETMIDKRGVFWEMA